MEKLQTQTKVEGIRQKYGLSELKDNLYNKGFQLNYLQQKLHEEVLRAMAEGKDLNTLNTLALGVRLQESLIYNNLTDEDQGYIETLRTDYDTLTPIEYNEKMRILFDRYDFVICRVDETVMIKNYYAEEGEAGGVLSTLISDRIAKYDQNIIGGVHGLPRSGKSRCVGRLGTNINKLVEKILGKKVGFSADDYVYSKEEYLRRLKERKAEDTLKGSVIVLEEAGDTLNSQRFWDKDVIGSVDILRQQGYNNTCLLVISQLYSDVVKKARGLYHFSMVPWKDIGRRSMDIEDIGNIDFEQGLSFWKIDLLDIDPMTGDAYPQGIRVALGKVKKVGVRMPPAKLNKDYAKKDEEHKDKKMDAQYLETISENIRKGNLDTIRQCAEDILKEINKYRNKKGTWKTSRISKRFNIGGRAVLRIRDEAEELYQARVAQAEKRTPEEGEVVGSNPTPGKQDSTIQKAENVKETP
jgi:hypothetical protein